ncbi:MAG: tetratricopeptide repeat protein [Deltaproteobacteria bacterium]|nr:tetratricopeptide repeat protein [Deltaproteobacteria bacterium]
MSLQPLCSKLDLSLELQKAMKKFHSSVFAMLAASSFLVACNHQGQEAVKDPVTGDVVKTQDGKVINKEAAEYFKKAVDEIASHDAAGDWSDAVCDATAKKFQDAASKLNGGEFFEALYDSGVAYQRCKDDAKAKAVFDEILSKNPKFHRARVQVALYKYVASNYKEVEPAIKEMQQAIEDAEFKNEEALVHLAMLQMQRDNDVKDDDGDSDFDRAKGNLQRALAINDGFMPAFNQLAVFYLESAKKKAQQSKGGKGAVRSRAAIKVASDDDRKADSQALELAQLVSTQAIRKNPNYAPVYNTMGLISAELGDLSQAAQSFGKARAMDPKFFEAHMNYAAVNLQFRGFEEAVKAYRAAISLRPNDFEAHLGLGLGYRGLVNDSNFDQMVAEAQKEILQARKLDAARPESYYNDAILVEEFKTKNFEGEKAIPVYDESKALFRQFIEKATGKSEYASSVKRAEERIKDIDDIVSVIKENAAAAKNPPPAPPPAAGPAPAGGGATAGGAPAGGGPAGGAPPGSGEPAPAAPPAAPK